MSSKDTAWVSSVRAAELLGITQRTVYKLIDTGELVAYKIGRTIRLREQGLQEYLDRSRIQPGALRHLYPEESGAA